MADSTNACILGIVSSFTRKQAAEFFGKNLVANIESVCYDSYLRAISTVVAHFLHTEGVGGSNPSLPIAFIISSVKGFRFLVRPRIQLLVLSKAINTCFCKKLSFFLTESVPN